jgi:membrane associated rhomboid family serine protease
VIPIGDQRIRGAPLPIVTIVLLVANVLVFIYEATLSQPELQGFIETWGAVPAEIVDGRGYYTLISSMFVHGGWFHLASNMLFLWIFGDNIEVLLGHVGYLIFYLLGGVAASGTQILASPSSTLPSVGASGAVAAILGAYVLAFPQAYVRVLLFLGIFITTTRVTAILFVGVWALTQFLNGIAALGVQTAQTGGVAYWAHIGGLVFGVLVGLLFRARAGDLYLERGRR